MSKKPEDQEKTGILDSIKEDRYVLIVAVAVLLFISGAIIAFQPALQNESQALAPVTMLSASVQDGNVSLSWKASDSATAIGYDIYLSIEPDVLGGKINAEPISGLSYMDTVAVPGTYYYAIRTVSETGDDGNTAQLQVIAEAPAAPTSLFISINDGAEYTNEGSVSLSLSADGAQECRYKNTEDSEWGEYEEYQASKRWELGSGEDGLRSVEYQCKGNDGTESEIISGSIILDSQALAPVTMLSASVQDGNVSLSWKASDSAAAIGYDIYLSIEPDVLGGKINAEPISGLSYMDTVTVPGTYYYTIRTVSETGDDGNTAQLQVIAEAPAAPTSLFISINDGAEYTNEGSVSLSLSADGAQECRYKNTEDSEWGEYEEYQASKRWELGSGEDGLRSVEYQCKGNDGTESEIISGSIILDSQVPIFWYALSTSGGAAQATVIVTNETAANSIECTPIIDLSEGEPFIIDINLGTGSYTYIRQLNPGSHSFSLSCHDEAGNAKSTMPRAFQVK